MENDLVKKENKICYTSIIIKASTDKHTLINPNELIDKFQLAVGNKIKLNKLYINTTTSESASR